MHIMYLKHDFYVYTVIRNLDLRGRPLAQDLRASRYEFDQSLGTNEQALSDICRTLWRSRARAAGAHAFSACAQFVKQ